METAADLTVPQPPAPAESRVSVILPLYRAGPELADALARLASTLRPADELIVVDDGTPAPEDAALARLVRDHTPAARLLVLPHNRGVAAARNQALRHATGRYVWFVDWDDEWDPALLDVLVDRAEATGAPVVSCRARVVDERGHLLRHIGPARDVSLSGPQTAEALLDGRLEGHLWNKLFRRDLLPADVFPLMPTLSDLVGTAPVLAAAGRVEHIGRVLYEHRIRPGSLTATGTRDLAPLLAVGTQVPAAVTPYLGRAQERDRLATLFRHRSAYLTAVTALRLAHDGHEQARWAQRSRRLLSVPEAAALVPTSPATAARSLALLALGRVFAPAYRAVTRLRRLTHRARRAPWHRGDGRP